MGDTEHSPASNDIDEHWLPLLQWPYQKKKEKRAFFFHILFARSYSMRSTFFLFFL